MIRVPPPSWKGPTRTTSCPWRRSMPSWILLPTIRFGAFAARASVTSCASETPSSENSARAASIAIVRPSTGAARGPGRNGDRELARGWADLTLIRAIAVGQHGRAAVVEGEAHPDRGALSHAAEELDPVRERVDQGQPEALNLELGSGTFGRMPTP